MAEFNAQTPVISARQISKGFSNYGERIDILKQVDLDIHAGESLAIVGASGIGKSTFLHIFGTLSRPDKGELLYQGENILGYNDSRLARFRNESVGFVFQFHHLLPEFTAAENVMMPCLINGMTHSEGRKLAEAILVRVGLKERLDHRVTTLSGGEQQRVALARALVLKPLVLCADEPTGNLDQEHSRQVHRLLMDLNQEMGMILVVVTHNLELAALMGRQTTLKNGKLTEATIS
jgi:lipoprotein-releasing system ATP-binding protein